MKKPSISVVIPCFNAQGSIEQVIVDILKYLNSNERVELKEIICINDFSLDKTKEVLKDIASKYNKVKFFSNTNNVGQVQSTLVGIEASKGEYIVTLDDDNQHPPSQIEKIINKCIDNDHDFVTGFWEKDETYIRNITSSLANLLINLSLLNRTSYRISAFRVIKSTLKGQILTTFHKSSLMDLRKISNNYGVVKVEHNPNPLNRQFTTFIKRLRITLSYLFFETYLSFFLLLCLLIYLILF